MMAERRNLRRRGKYFGGRKRKLVKETFNYQATDGQQTAGTFRKHDNMLKQFLDTWEGIHGFNAASDGEGGLPGRTPLLTGFVQPPDFRKYLLKHGFHWTDIGVAANHGEFTHRLHWYIICAEQMATPQWLLHQPIDLFKKCAEAETVNSAATSGSIWDRLFDHLATTATDGPAAGREVVFRKAETLHAFLRQDVIKRRQDLWVLAQIVDSRAGRVQLINTLAGNGGTKRLDLDIEDRQEANKDNLMMVGDFSTKIVWQRIQEGQGAAELNEFLS